MTVVKHKYSCIFAVLAVLSFCLFTNPPAHAGEIEDAQAFIENLADRAFTTLNQGNLSNTEIQEEFRNLLAESMDIDFVANFVLGPYRRKASDAQIAHFADVLEDYIVLAYAYRFKEFEIKKLVVTGAEIGKRNTVSVASIIDVSDETPKIHIDWRTHKVNGDWRVIDISIEGLSMVTVQREEYISVIRQGGGKVGYLIAALEKKNKKLAKRNAN